MNKYRQSLGERGEQIGREYLEGLGYRLIGKNMRTAYGEVDLIMKDGEVWVFVEVKTRRTAKYGTPLEAITPHKFSKMVESAQDYMQTQVTDNTDWRMDVVGVTFLTGDSTPKIEHIINAQL